MATDGDLISGIACSGRCWKYRSGIGKYGKYSNKAIVGDLGTTGVMLNIQHQTM